MAPNPHVLDELYAFVGEEVANKEFHPGPMARAVAESQGKRDLVQGLYIKFRVEELYRSAERDAALVEHEAKVAEARSVRAHKARFWKGAAFLSACLVAFAFIMCVANYPPPLIAGLVLLLGVSGLCLSFSFLAFD